MGPCSADPQSGRDLGTFQMKLWKCTVPFVVGPICLAASFLPASSAPPAPKEVLLSTLWHPGPNGVVVQVPRGTMLIFDAKAGGEPYALKGGRLVVRAAVAELRGAVVIRSWTEADQPKKNSPFTSAAAKGPDGGDCDRACRGGDGKPGLTGDNGATGETGYDAGPITINLGSFSGTGSLVVFGVGSRGGEGQDGQPGGKGGTAGRGGDADTDRVGICKASGGDAGTAGPGGPGGKGGKGGPGGKGAVFRVSSAVGAVASKYGNGAAPGAPAAGKIQIVYAGGSGGAPGGGGNGGDGGNGNDGGSGKGGCGGGHGSGKGATQPPADGEPRRGRPRSGGQRVVDEVIALRRRGTSTKDVRSLRKYHEVACCSCADIDNFFSPIRGRLLVREFDLRAGQYFLLTDIYMRTSPRHHAQRGYKGHRDLAETSLGRLFDRRRTDRWLQRLQHESARRKVRVEPATKVKVWPQYPHATRPINIQTMNDLSHSDAFGELDRLISFAYYYTFCNAALAFSVFRYRNAQCRVKVF